MIDSAALRADRSWQLTWTDGRLDEAVFRLDPDTAADRRDLVERLGADPTDPERWESALVEAVLTDPASADLRRLELRLTDFHHSASRAAAALAAHRRDRLTTLYFGHDFEFLYEDAHTSTGGRFDPLSRLHEGFADDIRHGLWAALPALRELTAEGGLLFDEIGGAALTDLRLRGAVLADGAVFPHEAPGVVSLVVDSGTDVFGVACPVDHLAELGPRGWPALRHLDLSRAEFDPSDLATVRALAESRIVPQLATLTLGALRVNDHEADDPIGALTALAPAFAHLTLTVAGETNVDGAARALSGVDR
ncbi:hypothetical protein V5P93_002597 [Actinokineospora auranticolor]|uniref:Uncharacterized protein n=1 Tax=Actinokineospora auranticolor TaxID=155976 RepID=A0A2S6GMA9_9PSEU|nr:hypothetical protein [Actinokineospora auranticolor]PPK66374.1 hypothetical protein CLV40_11078 [Actinokineospora auranticolor]